MKHIFLYFLVSLCSFSLVKAQSKLGDVACVYITTTNLDSSVAVYEKLGFSKTGENTYPTPWVQVSDGSLIIMLRKDDTPYIGLTYYVADVEKVVAALEKDSIVFTQKPKADDLIKRYYFKSPDGFNIMLSNNLGGFKKATGTTMITMKPEDFTNAEKYPNKQCGVFGEFAYPVKDINASLAFWKKLGYHSNSIMKFPYPYAIISDGMMLIGLHQTNEFNYPVITYFGINTEKRVDELKAKGVQNINEMMGKKNVIIKTWEGQHFNLFSVGM